MKIKSIVDFFHVRTKVVVSVSFANDFPDDSFVEVGMLFPIVSVKDNLNGSYWITLDTEPYSNHNLTLCKDSSKFIAFGNIQYCFMKDDLVFNIIEGL